MTTTVVNNSLFGTFFEKQKLTRINFIEWYRNLRIVLSVKDKLPFLKQPIPVKPVPVAGQVIPQDVHNTHTAWVKASKKFVGLILMTMDPDIQKNLEHLGAYDMLKELKSYIDKLECLGHAMTQNLSVSLILVSLKKEYDGFVQNYNIHSIGKTVTELHAMLKLHEQTLPPKEMGYALVQAPPFAPKPNNPPTPKKDNPGKDAICHQCGEVGHWRRNCLIYLVELMKKKKLSQGASTSGIFTIELYYFPSTSWVYDTVYGTHICITTQGLRESRKQKSGALNLYVSDGHRAVVEAIGKFHLCLPSGLVLILHNCHYAPSITRGIISFSRFYKDVFVNHFENDNSISVSKNNLIYFNAIPWDDIYEIVLSSSNTNDSSMYTVTNKRAKLNLHSALLWHYRIGHINKKRIEKLQHDGLLNSTDIKFFEMCVACMFGKMARKPYSHQVERANDLLGLIHTDVCGSFKITSRQGASYFVTFTDDFSRYGYVYLHKHKHEVFETFKVFQKEVENHLGKTIKLLRSDNGGEYMSQEFLDHLKEHGIIAHPTPPYTPQHNGVSEKRNRTLLDMFHSMMSQTTLPKSFWDYALESAARILNMVLTKKVLVKRDTLTKPDKMEPRAFKSSGSIEDLEIIQEEDTHPSIDSSLNHKEDDQEIDEPQSDINPICRSTRTRRTPDQMCLYIDAEEHELGDLDEPANYKAALLDLESDKWLNAMNVEMQSMKDNKVWELVDLPPNGKTLSERDVLRLIVERKGLRQSREFGVRKADPQLQQQDIAIWLALQMKFERNTVLQTACRTPAVHPRDQDDPHDDAHPEGENSAKWQKTSQSWDSMFIIGKEYGHVAPQWNLNAEQADWRDDIDDEPDDHELEAHYMYMAQIQEVTPDAADNSGPILDTEPLQKEENSYHDDDLAKEHDLLASLIEKLKCEIDDSKNRNKFLESSNKTLVDKLKSEIEDFKPKIKV
ncbi:zinc finger, CCHC-type containing protein [Tanacetum coccineum]